MEICFRDSFRDGRGRSLHHAIDILGDVGLIIASSTDGTVANYYLAGRVFRGVDFTSDHGGGNIVVIIDRSGYMHYYAHLKDRGMVSPGQRVFAGQQIGWLGRTGAGRFGPPHLHYQIATPRRESGPHSTNGYSAREAGKQPYNQFNELFQLAKRGPYYFDHRGRITIPPKDGLPPAPGGRP
jgi:murein DD-endopeptidase MepM/ murein hydrolase activator NlpD